MKTTLGRISSIARFIVDSGGTRFEGTAAENAKRVLADTFAVMLAGAASEVAEPFEHEVARAGEQRARIEVGPDVRDDLHQLGVAHRPDPLGRESFELLRGHGHSLSAGGAANSAAASR